MISLIEAYAPERQGRVFGFFDTVYAWPHKHRGLDVREQEPGGRWSVVTDVIAIEGGEVVHAGPAPIGKLGGTVVIRTNRAGGGTYESHSHTVPTVKRGDRVKPGDRIGRNAGPNDLPIWRGSSWRGSHDHIVFSDFSDGAWNTARPVFDPAPIIRAALARPAGGNSRPVPEEDDMAWLDEKAPDSGLTWAELLRNLAYQNTDGIAGRKSDGTQVKRLKRTEANTAANNAALNALARVIERQASGEITKAEIIKAVRDSTTAEVKKALKDIEIDVTVSTGEK